MIELRKFLSNYKSHQILFCGQMNDKTYFECAHIGMVNQIGNVSLR